MTYVTPMGSAHEGAPSPHRPAPRRRRRGPIALMVIGAVLIVGAFATSLAATRFFVGSLPTDILDAEGKPGSQALGSGAVPGRAQLTATAGSGYVVWAVSADGGAFAKDDVSVECGGHDPVVIVTPEVSSNASRGEISTRTVAQFTAPADGECTVAVEAPTSEGASFLVTEATQFDEFFRGIGGSIVLTMVAIGAGIAGVGLLIGGVVWLAVSPRRAPAGA